MSKICNVTPVTASGFGGYDFTIYKDEYDTEGRFFKWVQGTEAKTLLEDFLLTRGYNIQY